MNKLIAFSFLAGILWPANSLGQPLSPSEKNSIDIVLNHYTSGFTTGRIRVASIKAPEDRLDIYASTNFSYISFDDATYTEIITPLNTVIPDTYSGRSVDRKSVV